MAEGDLSFFVMLARRESFSATAQDLGLSASAVSRRLARLEDRLGVRLLNRTTRKVSLTSEGEAYYGAALRLLDEIADLEHNLSQGRDRPAGLLRINATLGFGRTHLAPAIARFRRIHPAVEVQLLLTDAPLNLVEEGIDLGIRFGAPALRAHGHAASAAQPEVPLRGALLSRGPRGAAEPHRSAAAQLHRAQAGP